VEKEELIINKDNYKGYVELYKAKKNMDDNGFEYIMGLVMILLAILAFSLTLMECTLIIDIFISVSPIVTMFEILALCGVEAIVGTIGIKNIFNRYNKRKKIINEVKQKYPYVDVKVNDYMLKSSLEKSKIITYEIKNNESVEKLDVISYENYLKAEKIKERYIQETKYDSYIINAGISNNELEKPKVKKLVR